jgi:hypothetical protein
MGDHVDRLIETYDCVEDGDLNLCRANGVAYQRDMFSRIQYGADYLEKFNAYDAEVAARVNAGRCNMILERLAGTIKLLDVGAGDGRFVRAANVSGIKAKGYDVIEEAAQNLRMSNLYSDDPSGCDAVTFWDVLEHMEDPGAWLRRVPRYALLFASVPIFQDLAAIRASKHYRPGEHLYYWTSRGFSNWMWANGFAAVSYSSHEIDAGRDSIGAYCFARRKT